MHADMKKEVEKKKRLKKVRLKNRDWEREIDTQIESERLKEKERRDVESQF